MIASAPAADRIAACLPRSGHVFVQGCASESSALADAVEAAGARLGALTFTGIRVPGVNKRNGLSGPASRVETFFMTPELTEVAESVDFLPLCYSDIARRWRVLPPAAALFAVSPPDSNGLCSFGPTVDFLAELWPQIPIRLAHINPLLPRTTGPTGIPFDALEVVIDAPEPMAQLVGDAADRRTDAIAANVASLIGDGATLQIGLGKLPSALLRALTERRNLRIHSGLIGDGVLDLLNAGTITRGPDITAGVAIGTQRLYEVLPESGIVFRPVSYTHDSATIAAQPNFVAINSVMAVDCYGQGYSEVGPEGWSSGAGGATDFARGALAGNGLRIVALPSSAGSASRIVVRGRGPVTLARTDIDIVVTEHGIADLRWKTHAARAAALIAIASPYHQETLARAWRDDAAKP